MNACINLQIQEKRQQKSGMKYNSFTMYRKFPRYSDTQKICCNYSKIWTVLLYHRVNSPNDADGMANSVDPDQVAPRSSLIWVCTVCPGISVRKLRIITVCSKVFNGKIGHTAYHWYCCLYFTECWQVTQLSFRMFCRFQRQSWGNNVLIFKYTLYPHGGFSL